MSRGAPAGKRFLAVIAGAWLLVVAPETVGFAWTRDGEKAPLEETAVDCTIVYDTVEGFYVDVGVEKGLYKGLTGWLVRDGERLVRVQVAAASSRSSFVRPLSARAPGFPVPQDGITLLFTGLRPAVAVDEDEAGRRRDPQAPLLAPELGDVGVNGPQNEIHGRVSLQEVYQTTTDGLLDYSRTQLRTSGEIDRLGGTPWSLEWSGSFAYRSGDGLEDVRDNERVRDEIYRLALSRRFEDYSTLRLGRFLPRELPAVGFLDGVQGEHVVSDHVRLGGMLGFKPDRDDLQFSTEELAAVPYVTYHEADDDHEYSGTVGLMAAYYEGDLDRFAVLLDQRARFGQLDLFTSTEVDFDVGSFESRSGTRLTRFDLVGNYRFEGWSARAGLDRFEALDVEAERDLVTTLVLPDSAYFEDGYWRYFVGGNHPFGNGFFLDEEVSYTDSSTDDDFRYRLTVGKRDVLWWPSATATLSVYNLVGAAQDGYGARLSAYIPVTPAFMLQPSVAGRYIDYDTGDSVIKFVDGSLRAHWYLSPTWSTAGGVSWAASDGEQRILADLGITWTF